MQPSMPGAALPPGSASLPKHYDAAATERKWRERWLEADIYRWDASRPREETFIIDSPPPTVSGSLHMGHMFSYSHQDLLARQRRMKGMNIFYPMGWDDNGLPTERRVQNLLNVRCDPYVPYQQGFRPASLTTDTKKKGPAEVISRQNFIELCQEVTATDEGVFKALFQHLGLSIDWNLEYATINAHCRRTSQLSFLKLLADGYAYSVHAPTQWDVDYQSAVAQAETEDRMQPGAFHSIRFGVEGGGSFVIATTRPELLPACVAVVAHPSDVRYQPLFGRRAITPLFRMPVPILPDERADPEKGTGILMVCTFGDNTDVEWWRQYRLPLRQVVGRNGRLLEVSFDTPEFPSLRPDAAHAFYAQLVGKSVKQARGAIVELLRQQEGEALPGLGVPLTEEPRAIEHAVRFYERGDRPLELVPTRQWFVKLLEHRSALIEQGRKIEWHPGYMRARYENWVEGLNQDWCISRQRYFGVPFPVWYPLDAQGEPDTSRPLLPSPEMLPVDPLGQPAPGYEEAQRGRPNGFIGDPDVMDTWATSSLTPQISSHWTRDPERHRRVFPMDIRPQAHEIIRTWAFYTITKAYFHEREIPWKNVVISGWVLDPNREKMSKSKGNVVTPESVLEKYSADAIRYWTARARLGVDTAYDESVFNNGRRLTTKLFNAAKFVAGLLEGVDPTQLGPGAITFPLDRDFVARLRGVITRADAAFERFDFATALAAIEEFFWTDLCDNYLELIKSRAYSDGLGPGRLSALATLRLATSVQLRLLAPFLPYLTEECWSWMFACPENASRFIHTSPWPGLAELALVAVPAEHEPFGAAVEVLAAVRKAKGEAHVSMKHPVDHLEVRGMASDLAALLSAEADLLPTAAAPAMVKAPAEARPEAGRFVVSMRLAASEQA